MNPDQGRLSRRDRSLGFDGPGIDRHEGFVVGPHLGVATEEEIAEELFRRKKEANAIHPPKLDSPDFTLLIQMVETSEAKSAAERRLDENFKHWVYEEVLATIYGPEYWMWRRKQGW